MKEQASFAGDQAGEEITKKVTEKIKVIKDDPTIKNAGVPIGDTIGDTISKHVTEKIKVSVEETFNRDNGSIYRSVNAALAGRNETVHQKVKVDVDVDEQTFGSRLHSFFDRFKARIGIDEGGFKGAIGRIFSGAGSEVGDSFRSGFQSIFSSDIISSIVKGSGLTAAIAAAFAAVGPLLSSTLGLAFGGGFIAAGIASAVKDPTVAGAIGDLKKKLSGAFSGLGELFRAPALNFLNRLPETLKPLEPMFDQIKRDLAPVAENLSNGVIGFLQNILPSIGRAIDKSAPILDTLADNLPGIGDQIARLFDTLSSHSDDAAQFFNGLLDGVKLLLKFLDVLLNVSFGAYETIRDLLTGLVLYGTKAAELLLDAFVGAFGWIPGIRSKLDGAKAKMDDFANHVVKELNKVPDSKTFTLYIRTVGTNAGATLQNIGRILGKAAGGITGSANGATPSGLTWVGENGPELLAAPAGSRVYSNPDSMRMAAAGGGGQSVTVGFDKSGLTGLARAIVETLRAEVRTGGGNVQRVLGVPGAA